MKTKIIFLIVFFLSINNIYAKKANAVWYFLAKTNSSVTQDNNISVQYGIYTRFANTDYSLGPYPTLRIKITNKSDQIIFVDLGTSYIKKNDVASVIYTPTITSTTVGQSIGIGVNAGAIANAVGIGGIAGTALGGVNIGGSKGSSASTMTYAQRYVSIPPKSAVFLDDVPILTPGSEKALGDLFYFDEVGMGGQKRLWCLHHKFKDVESGKIKEYTEENTLFTIGCYLNYSFSEDFRSALGIETTYYVKMLIGSSMTTFPPGNTKEFKVIDKVFPEWRDEIGIGNLELIRLWAK